MSTNARGYSPVYHIHAFPVPLDGNCSGTLGHLDPFVRGETPSCNASDPQTCQVGDLSGKHGNITTSGSFQTTYVCLLTLHIILPGPILTLLTLSSYLDLYATTEEGLGSFFGNRSIVVHTQNKTRLNCANFSLVAGTQPPPSTSNSSSSPTASHPAQFTGSAAVKTLSFSAMIICLVGALLL
jgi:hypothetical protein